MRFVSWNMGCGGPSKYRKTHREAWELSRRRAPAGHRTGAGGCSLSPTDGLPGGRGQFIWSTKTNRDNGAALFIREGIDATAVEMTSPHAFLAAADVRADSTLRVVSAHLYPHSVQGRHQENLRVLFDTLKANMTGGRFVVAGDINAARRFDVIYKKKTYGKFFASVAKRGLHDCHFGLHGQDERTFWGKGEYQLDHFFVEESGKAWVRKCDVITTAETRRLSDHSPIALELA